jgi:hypothetical protein
MRLLAYLIFFWMLALIGGVLIQSARLVAAEARHEVAIENVRAGEDGTVEAAERRLYHTYQAIQAAEDYLAGQREQAIRNGVPWW